jgi:hypothetical protein
MRVAAAMHAGAKCDVLSALARLLREQGKEIRAAALAALEVAYAFEGEGVLFLHPSTPPPHLNPTPSIPLPVLARSVRVFLLHYHCRGLIPYALLCSPMAQARAAQRPAKGHN